MSPSDGTGRLQRLRALPLIGRVVVAFGGAWLWVTAVLVAWEVVR